MTDINMGKTLNEKCDRMYESQKNVINRDKTYNSISIYI